ncbi:hypothetical protein MRX96_040027 [Rhipicephalus microplus]
MSFYGNLQYLQYKEDTKKYERVDDNCDTLINKAEMKALVVSVGSLGWDGAAVNSAIVFVKVLIKSASTGRIGKLYRTPNDIKEVRKSPERFVHGSGKVLQQYVDKSEWADYKARIETSEVKLKDVRAINRSKYVEAISRNAP